MLPLTRNKNLLLYFLLLLVLASGIWLWYSELESDPPMYYAGRGQSLGTDPYQYSFHARNKLLFSEWDPFDYPRWIVYQHSITSLVSYLLFSATEVSRKNANLVGIILSLSGLIFMLLGLNKHHRIWVLPAVAICFLANVTLIVYGCLPYLENGLVFWSGLFFFIYTRYGSKFWGAILSGVVITGAMLTGKLFGALLLPIGLLAYFFSDERIRWKLILGTTISFLVSAGFLTVIFYGSDYMAAFTYIGEQSVALHGLPQAVRTPWDFLEALVSYGRINHLMYRDPELLMFLAVAVTLLSINLKKFRSLAPTTRLATFWLLIVMTSLSVLNYSPLRYSLFLIPAIILACFTIVDQSIQKESMKLQLKWPQAIILFLLFWKISYHLLIIFFYHNQPDPDWLLWTIGAIALVVSGISWLLFSRKAIPFSSRLLIYGTVVILALSMTTGFFRYRRTKILERNFDIQTANIDLATIVGPGAVISGPYAPTITADNEVSCFIHLFGVAWLDRNLFEKQPITHLAVDNNNFEEALRSYPEIRAAIPITSYWIRDIEVRLIDISRIFKNPTSNSYQPTDYEKAIRFYRSLEVDSAQHYAEMFYQLHPESRSAGLLMANILGKRSEGHRTVELLQALAQRFTTDFDIHFRSAQMMQMLAYQTNNKELHSLAMKYYEMAVKLNRYKAGLANKTYVDIKTRFSR